MSTTLKDERRRSLRTPHVAEAWIVSPTATNADEKREVTALNLSRHGIGFELEKPVPQGAFYVIEIEMGDQRMVSEVRIISCRAGENGTFQVGAEFC